MLDLLGVVLDVPGHRLEGERDHEQPEEEQR
jgi:hypothetical protein